MSVIRDDCEEREARVDRMIDTFRKAQTRRLATATSVNGDNQVVASRRDAHAEAAGGGATPTPTSRVATTADIPGRR